MRLVNISNPTSFSTHRSGWGYAMKNLMKFHSGNGLLLDDFIDITFGYNYEINLKKKVIPYKKAWIGFLHHPPRICPWYEPKYKASIDINRFLNTDAFLMSLQYCKGIFVLSNYLKEYLKNNFTHLNKIPIFVLKHPTEFGLYDWDFLKFKHDYSTNGIKLISIGYFLRNLSTLFLTSANKKLDKILMPSHLETALSNLEREIKYYNLNIDRTKVKILTWQNNHLYDKILEQSVGFLDLYDTSCNNAIIECMIRNTPILVNKHPSTIEYLGKNYPLYFKNSEDVSQLLTYDNIQTTAEYLKNRSKLELTGDYFSDQFQKCLFDISGSPVKKHPNNIIIKSSVFNHRHGWPWVISKLKKQNIVLKKNNPNNLYCNDFIEHTFKSESVKNTIINHKKYGLARGYNLFSYNDTDVALIDNKYYLWDNEWKPISNIDSNLQLNKISTYKIYPWIGFLHNPVDMPKWFDPGQNINNLLQNNDFIDSLKRCKKIFVLSESLKKDLRIVFKKHGINIPITNLKHPVPYNKNLLWNKELFLESRSIIQIGYWLRKLHTFWQLRTNLNKIWLYGDPFASKILQIENLALQAYGTLSFDDIASIKICIDNQKDCSVNGVFITKTNNIGYDKLLTSSIVFCNFYNCSASNAIVECIATNTPILINKLPSTIEYLGKNYPLFFNNIKQASKLSNDLSAIEDANEYLQQNTRLKENLNINQFISSFYQECKKICKK